VSKIAIGATKMKACLVMAVILAGASAEADSKTQCKGNPKVVGACNVVHGRLRFGNGTPALRIWPIGSKRLLGVTAGPVADDADEPIYPEKVKKLVRGEEDIYGDYEVCPFTPQKRGEMQMVCINSATNLHVEHYPDPADQTRSAPR